MVDVPGAVRVLLGAIITIAVGVSCDDRKMPPDGAIGISDIALFDTDSVLHEIRDIVVDSTGGVWVLTGLDPFVYRYQADGTLRGRFIRRGNGPGEMTNPWSLVAARDHDRPLVIWDPGSRRLIALAISGDVVSEIPFEPSGNTLVRANIDQISYGDAYRLEHFGSGYAVADYKHGVTSTADFGLGSVLRVDLAGNSTDTLIDFQRDLGAGRADPATARYLVPIPLWTTCGDELVVFDPFDKSIQWFDSIGDSVRRNQLDIADRPLEDAEIETYLRHVVQLELRGRVVDSTEIDRRIADIVAHQRDDFAEYAPAVVDMLCDPAGRIWLERFSTVDDARGYGREWIVKPVGKPAWKVTFPVGFTPYRIQRDMAVGVYVDDMDVQRVAIVRFPEADLAGAATPELN